MTPRMNILEPPPDVDCELPKARFNDNEIAHLTLAVAAINFKVQIGLRVVHPLEVGAASA